MKKSIYLTESKETTHRIDIEVETEEELQSAIDCLECDSLEDFQEAVDRLREEVINVVNYKEEESYDYEELRVDHTEDLDED